MWNLLQDVFSHHIPLLLISFFGLQFTSWLPPLSLERQCFAVRGLPVLTNIAPTHSVCCCSAELRDRAWEQQAQQEGRAGVTSLRSSTLHNAADKSWQGPAQRGPAAVQPPEPARHAEAALAPVSHTRHGLHFTPCCYKHADPRRGYLGPYTVALTALFYSISHSTCVEMRAILSSVLQFSFLQKRCLLF